MSTIIINKYGFSFGFTFGFGCLLGREDGSYSDAYYDVDSVFEHSEDAQDDKLTLLELLSYVPE